MSDSRQRIAPATRAQWRAWLRAHHDKSPGVWVVYAKKHTALPCPTYDDTVEEALCFGWIDGLINALDDTHYMRLFTPRKPKSMWAASNKTRVARLIKSRLMTAAGMAAITVAKKNGSWSTYDAAQAMKPPPELRTALTANAVAGKRWRALTDSQRRMFLFRLQSAKGQETRARRVREIVEFLVRGMTPAKAYEERRRARRVRR